jgi:hypothetical protein
VTAASFQNANATLAKVGISLDDAIESVMNVAANGTDVAQNEVFIQLMGIIDALLQVRSFCLKKISRCL